MVARQVLSEQKVLNIVLLSRLRNVWPGRDTPSVSRKRVMPVPIISDGMRKPKVTSSKRGFIFESSSALLPIMSQQGAMVEGASRTHSFKSVPEHLLSSCSLDRVRAFCTYRILAAAATSAAWSAAAIIVGGIRRHPCWVCHGRGSSMAALCSYNRRTSSCWICIQGCSLPNSL